MDKTLKKIRKDQGLTQSEMADIIGVSRSCIANWESGQRRPDIYVIKKYNKLFGYKEEIVAAFKRYEEESGFILDISMFNTEGLLKITRFYKEMLNDPKYLKKPLTNE